MKTLIVSVFLFTSLSCFGQSDSTKYQYVELVGMAKTFGKGYKIHVEGNDTYNERLKETPTMVEALNIMASDSWIFVQGFQISNNDNLTAGGIASTYNYRYLLRKKRK